MSLFLDFLKPKLSTLLAQMPLQIFLLLTGSRGMVESMELMDYAKQLENSDWASAKYTKQILSLSHDYLPQFKVEVEHKRIKIDLVVVQRGAKLLKQLLEEGELNQVVKDLTVLTGKAKEAIELYGNFSGGDLERIRMIKRINGAFGIPLGKDSLSCLLSELPYQLFLLIAEADGTIDKNERSRLLNILRKRDWCKSRCAQDFFVRTAYNYETLHKQQMAGLLKKDWKRINEAFKTAVEFFHPNEMEIIRDDLLRLSQEIAASSGGFVGIGAVSKEEQEAIEKIKKLFAQTSSSEGKKPVKKTASTKKTAPERVKKREPEERKTEDEEKKKGEDSKGKSDSDRNFAKLREHERVTLSGAKVEIEGFAEENEIQMVNITEKGILCEVIFQSDYLDLIPIKYLSITFPDPKNPVTVKQIRCRVIRTQILKWKENGLPHTMKIAWQLLNIPSNQKKRWDEMLKKQLQQKQS